MTCPVGHASAELPTATDGVPAISDVGDRFERFTGSVFVGFFGAALFDQTMLPAVAAALEDTGRIRYAPLQRALRTAASDQIVFVGDEADRRAEAERLVRLHRDVKGVGANGVRYSALNPQSWNWILISTFFVHRGAFVAITGEQLSAADDQAIWDRFRQLTADLQLPGRSALIENYGELSSYYDQVAADSLEATPMLDRVVEHALRPPRPSFLPGVAAPLWQLTAGEAGHFLAVLGFGIMNPEVRALVPMTWTRRHEFEFAIATAALRIAYRRLPARLTDTPLARNRRQYQRIMNKYKGIGLASFVPDQPGSTRKP
ncbi:MAG: hypothetical protein QOG79_5708 [Mycobacterium sp.]|nr:hypothetical protein [Mycobacterium sp.]